MSKVLTDNINYKNIADAIRDHADQPSTYQVLELQTCYNDIDYYYTFSGSSRHRQLEYMVNSASSDVRFVGLITSDNYYTIFLISLNQFNLRLTDNSYSASNACNISSHNAYYKSTIARYYADFNSTSGVPTSINTGNINFIQTNINRSYVSDLYDLAYRYAFGDLAVDPITYTPDEMIDAISYIPNGHGQSITVSANLNISSNGIYTIEPPYDAFSQVIVNITELNTCESTFSNNGTYTPGSLYEGFSKVNITNNDPNLISYLNKTLTSYSSTTGSIITAAFNQFYNLSSVNLPECSIIGQSAFAYCTHLKFINIPKCTYIPSEAFNYCLNLESITCPECISIYQSAFRDCALLTTVSFPACTYIASNAFYNCSKLESIYLLNSSVCSLISNAFFLTPIYESYYLGYFGSIYVPESLVADYKAASSWSYYADRITAYTK